MFSVRALAVIGQTVAWFYIIYIYNTPSSSLGSRSVPWLGKGLTIPSPSHPVLCCPLPDRAAPVFVQVVSPPLGWSPLSVPGFVCVAYLAPHVMPHWLTHTLLTIIRHNNYTHDSAVQVLLLECQSRQGRIGYKHGVSITPRGAAICYYSPQSTMPHSSLIVHSYCALPALVQ